jgi:hypothetical protein
MNIKQVFATVWNGFQEQRDFGWDSALSKCRYRTKDNKRCAIGMLIPDEVYDPAIETADTAFVCDLIGYTDPAERQILMNLQVLHDKFAFHGRDRFRSFQMALIGWAVAHDALDDNYYIPAMIRGEYFIPETNEEEN